MSGHRARVTALQTLIAGSPLPPNDIQRVIRELNEVFVAGRVRIPYRRLLLQVLHSTRALDSTLGGLITASGGAPPNSLGNALRHLKRTGLNRNRLTETLGSHYQREIVKPRNTYMHQAGSYPASTAEIAKLLADMQQCLVDAVNLW